MNGSETTLQKRLTLSVFIWLGIKSWLRRDFVVIVLYVIASLLMTYPLIVNLGGQWLAFRDADTYMKLWDNWWLKNHAFNEPSLTFTNLLFYPSGLDLSYHSISWTVALLSWALTEVTDAITAYNLTILIAIFSTAYAAYLLVRPLVDYGAAAWLAGAIYSFAPYHIVHSGGHPDLVHLAPIPLAVLLLIAAITRPSVIAALGAAVMVGLAGFTSLYIMVFALLTLGPVLIFLLLEKNRWSQAKIWRVVLVFSVTISLLLIIRLVPILRDTDALTEAIESKNEANLSQTDLLSYVVPSPLNPFFAPYTKEISSQLSNFSRKWPAYLGLVPLALTIVALTWKKHRKIVLLWFSIGLIFVILSLGPALRFKGNLYEDIVLPARYVSWIPPIRAVGNPDFFVIGVLLPVAVLAAVGDDRLLIRLEGRQLFQIGLVIAFAALLLVEYWSGKYPGVSTNVDHFYEQMAHEPGEYAIIQLPMGRNQSKYYLFLQSIHQKAIVEGLSGRTPDEAYNYIQSNPLLLKWFNRGPLNCTAQNQHLIISALDELVDDEFRYVVVHHTGSELPVLYADYFPIEPVYQDRDLTAFELSDLQHQSICQEDYEREIDLPSPQISTSILWDQRISLLGYDLPNIDPGAEELPITLYWQAQLKMENSYIFYFHLIDSETGILVSQADVVPWGWSYPTNWWAAGEVVEDTVQIPIEKLRPGQYELRMGWYDEETGTRMNPESDQSPIFPDGSTLLTVIEI